MASYVEEVGIRMRADGVIETGSGIALTGKNLDDLQKKAAAAGRQMDGFTASSRQTQNALRQLPAQITDVVTSLASGQKPWMVFIQQGGQIKDSFGGILPAARALAGAMGPLGMALGAVGLAAAGVGAAMYNGWSQSREFQNSLALTGNIAGITEGQFNGLVDGFASAAKGAGNARDMLQALVLSGEATNSTFTALAAGAAALSRVNGQSAADSVKAFNGISDGVAAWAAKANRSYNYLTAEQYRHIMALESQGRSSEAVRVNMEALTSTLQARTTPQMGYLERAARATGEALDWMWQKASGWGRAETTEEKLRQVQAQLAYARRTLTTARDKQELRDQEAFLQEQLRMEKRAAEANAATAEQNQREIMLASREYGDSLLAIDSARNQVSLARTTSYLEAQRSAVDLAYQRGLITYGQYRDRMIAIERGALSVQEKLAQAEIAIETQRVAKTEAEVNQRAAAILSANARLVAVQGQRATLEAKIKADGFRPADTPFVNDDPVGNFRRSEIQAQNAPGASYVELVAKAGEAATEIRTTNKQLSAELILDERQRAAALLAIEAQQVRERLALDFGSDAERRQKQEVFAQWLVLRNRKLNQDLRPEWERMLDDWRDTQRLMREASDATYTAFLKNGEDAFVQLVTTGKISAGSLANAWLSELARVQWKKLVTGQFSLGDVGTGIGNVLGSVGSAIGSVAGWLGFGHHAGGLAGAEPSFTRPMPAMAWAGAPRLHSGGLAADEIPAILRKGEGVFTEGQMRNLAPVDRVAAAARPSVTYAPVFNVDSRSDRAELLAQMQRMTKASQAELVDMMNRGMV